MGKYYSRTNIRRRQLNKVAVGGAGMVVATMALSLSALTPSAQASATSNSYVVKKGDTVERISSKYHVSAASLVAANGIRNPNQIYVGTTLQIPSGKVVSATQNTRGSSASHYPTTLTKYADRLALTTYFDKWADANQVPRDMLKATCWIESGWQNKAVSSSGAQGIGQLLPSTSNYIATSLIHDASLNPSDPEANIQMSAHYLSYLIKLNGGNQDLALASYYQGFTSVKSQGLHADTIAYVKAVNSFRPSFK